MVKRSVCFGVFALIAGGLATGCSSSSDSGPTMPCDGLTGCPEAGADSSLQEDALGSPDAQGTDSAPAIDASPAADLSQAAELFTQLQCERFTACLGPTATLMMGDCATYERPYIEDRFLAGVGQAIAEGKILYHPEKLSSCAQTVRQLGCEQNVHPSIALCKEAFEGTVAQNGQCLHSFECAGDSYCQRDDYNGACPGICRPYLAEGQPCTDMEPCQPGLTCDVPNQKCTPGRAKGQACGGDNPPCAGLMACGAENPSSQNTTCYLMNEVQTVSEGQDCSWTGRAWCNSGLVCAYIPQSSGAPSFKCVRPSAADESCRASMPQACPLNQYCSDDMTDPAAGRCKDLPAKGQACAPSTTLGLRCQSGLLCMSETCQAQGRIGDSCSSADACYSDRCIGGKCASGTACAQ